jgi:hypothetical protein
VDNAARSPSGPASVPFRGGRGRRRVGAGRPGRGDPAAVGAGGCGLGAVRGVLLAGPGHED